MVFSITRYTFVSMEAKELRIGNLLRISDNFKAVSGTVISVIEINDSGIIHKIHDNQKFGSAFNILEGIPLTEEILLKCGFEEAYRSTFRVRYDHKDFMFIGYDINLSGIDNTATGLRYYGSHIKLNYLHELQNAFKVFTGEELKYTP